MFDKCFFEEITKRFNIIPFKEPENKAKKQEEWCENIYQSYENSS